MSAPEFVAWVAWAPRLHLMSETGTHLQQHGALKSVQSDDNAENFVILLMFHS